MEETSVKVHLKKLVELQKIDEQIYNFKRDLKEKPRVIEELKLEFENSKSMLNSLEDNHKHILVTRKDFEVSLQQKEDAISKCNADLSAIKTNKEYTAKIHEIENIKADKSKIEDQILNSFDEAEAAQGKIDAEKQNVKVYENAYLEKKSEIEAQMTQTETRVKELETAREAILPEIDKNYLSKYQRILENKSGQALAAVVNGVCGGCNMNITQQMINLIKMGEDLVSCEVCARILYTEEDL